MNNARAKQDMSVNSPTITVLDCTLRDGGYYNNWEFDRTLVERYLEAVHRAGVTIVEIGLRFPPKDQFLGPYAYCTDDFLSSLAIPPGLRIGVMVNAGDLIKHPQGPAEAVRRLFGPADRSVASLVRIAAHEREVAACAPAVRTLHELGYGIGFNLMQVTRCGAEALAAAARQVASWQGVEALYFADSLGNMRRSQIRDTIAALRQGWEGPIGIHAHDNMGGALNNTLEAMEMGATWLDATILGMGRGAGNARTEFLLCELGRSDTDAYDADALLPLVMEDFTEMQREFGWGPSLLYYMSARDNIHPTYVQSMQSDQRYELSDILAALRALRGMEGHSFSFESLVRALTSALPQHQGQWDSSGWLAGRDVLLLGAGPSAARHRDALTQFIAREQPAVLCLNTAPAVPAPMVTAFVACHPTRMLMDLPHYRGLSRPLVAPAAFLPPVVRTEMAEGQHLDYGVQLTPHQLETSANGCVVPSLLVAAYALALATSAGGRRILLAGFDGFDASDPRQAEMVEVFEVYHRMPNALPIVALTPTSYPVQQSSVYAPTL